MKNKKKEKTIVLIAAAVTLALTVTLILLMMNRPQLQDEPGKTPILPQPQLPYEEDAVLPPAIIERPVTQPSVEADMSIDMGRVENNPAPEVENVEVEYGTKGEDGC